MSIIPFNFESKEIRVVEIDGEPWFVAKDVAVALGYTNTNDAISRHCKGVVKRYPLMTPGGTQEARIISESDVLRLIVGSALPEAVQFESWVFETVLPSIRKNGGYIAGQETDDPELIMAKALQVAQNVIDRKTLELKQAKEIIAIQAPKAEFVDKYVSSSSGNMTFRDVAKLIRVNERVFRDFLKANKIMYRLNGTWAPYQSHIEAGRFEVKTGLAEHENSSHAFKQAMFTPKGVEWVAGEYAKHMAAKAIKSQGEAA